MARVFGVHEIELKPGADPAELERAYAEVVGQPMFEGWKIQLLKGERGARAGKYLVLFEIESIEARDRYYPAPQQQSDEEISRFSEQNPSAIAAWGRVEEVQSEQDVATDYVVIAE